MEIRYATTSSLQVVGSNYVKTRDSFALQLPELERFGRSKFAESCLGVHVSIELRKGLKLNDWELTTGNLAIEVADGLFSHEAGDEQQSHLQVTGSSSFTAVSGACKIAYWSSRRTVIETISGSISGAFDLLDLLFLKSTSGTITSTVEPKQADEASPAPAELSVNSLSGTIDVRLPVNGSLPKRDYQTRLESVSSDIRGSYIHGSSTSIHTSSGDIHVDLLPYVADPQQNPNLHTATHSGATDIRMLSPHSFPGDSFAAIHSDHKTTSISGTVKIAYPDEWEGLVAADSTSGSISIRGKGVKIIDDTTLMRGFEHVVARKGDGKGRIGIKTVSGTIGVKVGEV
jgi:DUF4097 and DUF4098 domain-containing protein YvlB